MGDASLHATLASSATPSKQSPADVQLRDRLTLAW
jgi:hypothetical protein